MIPVRRPTISSGFAQCGSQEEEKKETVTGNLHKSSQIDSPYSLLPSQQFPQQAQSGSTMAFHDNEGSPAFTDQEVEGNSPISMRIENEEKLRNKNLSEISPESRE